jgi:hypothetical protein
MSILKNINYIIQLDRIPCATPDAWIIIKTAFASAPPAFMSLFAPGCNDIVKTKLGLSPWHARSIRSVIKAISAPEALGANKFLYKIGYFTIEKYLWWWMVADVTTEFVTTWQSMVYQEQQCQLPGAGTSWGHFAPFVYVEGIPAAAFWVLEHFKTGVLVGGGQITILPGFEATIAYTLRFEGYPDPAAQSPVTTWWVEEGNPTINDLATTNDPLQQNGNQTGGSLYHSKPGSFAGTNYKIGVSVDGPNQMRLIDGRWNVSLTGRKQGNLTFGCDLKPVEWPFPNPLS